MERGRGVGICTEQLRIDPSRAYDLLPISACSERSIFECVSSWVSVWLVCAALVRLVICQLSVRHAWICLGLECVHFCGTVH